MPSVLRVDHFTARARSRLGRRQLSVRAQQFVFVATWLVPIMALFLVFALLPIGIVVWLSFHRYDQLAPTSPFVGFSNYVYALTEDPYFKNALGNTLTFATMGVVINLLASLPIALGLNQIKRFAALFRIAFFMPAITSAVVVSLVWLPIYDPMGGWLNSLLRTLGLSGHSWLGDPSLALWAVLAATLWQDLGYNILVFLAGLQGIPEEFYDAAKVDGAGRWARFIHVTLPLLRRTLALVLVLTMIYYLQEFTHVWVMTSGGPIHSSETLVLYTYLKGFRDFRMGYAAALSVILMVTMFIVTLVQLRVMRTRWEY